MSKRRTHVGKATPLWLVAGILVYLGLALTASAIFLVRAWPGNAFARPIYAVEERRVALLQVTVESIQKIDEAFVLLNRLPDLADTPTFSQDDVERVLTRLAFAEAVVKRAPEVLRNKVTALSKPAADGKGAAVPAAPTTRVQAWSGEEVRQVAQLLRCAHAILELRASSLTQEGSAGIWTHMRSFLVFPDAPNTALTNTEESRLAKLLAATDQSEVQTPAPVSEKTKGVSAEAQTAAALPNLISGLRQLNFIMLLAALGAAGATTQSLASVASYLGAQKLNASWTAFYLTRPWIGAVLGPVFYLVLRGGLMTPQANWKDVNQFGYAAVAVLVGFCASEAMENLRSIGRAFFRSKEGKDGLESPEPFVQSGSIEHDPNQQDHRVLQLRGSNFSPEVEVIINGTAVAADTVHRLDASTLAVDPFSLEADTFFVQVRNPGTPPQLSNRIEIGAKTPLFDRLRRARSKKKPSSERTDPA